MATYNWVCYFFMEQTAKYFGLIGRLVSVVAAAISRVAAAYTEK